MSEFSDEELTAYLDGELDGEAALVLERALKGDANLEKRLQALSLDLERLRAAFAGPLAVAPPAPKLHDAAVARSAPPRPTWSKAAVAASIAVACFIGGWLTGSATKQDDWRDLAAAYHALYTPETLATATEPEARIDGELQRASAALGIALKPAIMTHMASLGYRRTQLLGIDGAPIAQIAFLSQRGAPIALCIRAQSASGTDAPIQLTELRGMAAAMWARGGYEFLLIGGENADEIAAAAAFFAQQI